MAIIVVATFEAKKGMVEKLKSQVSKLLAPTRAEKGCRLYDLHQDDQKPESFLFYEIWETNEALEKHLQSSHLKEILASAMDLITKAPDIRTFKKIES